MRGRLFWLFALLLLAALVALMPMRLFLGDGPLSARAIRGSIWSAEIEDAHLGAIPLGNMTAGLGWPGLLRFRDGDRISGSLSPWSDGVSVKDLNGKIALSAATPYAQEAELVGLAVDFDPSGCKAAKGRVRLQLAKTIAGIPMGQMLVGSPKCDGRALVLHLASQSGLEQLTLTLPPTGRATTVVILRPTDREAVPALLAAGFTETPTGYRLSIDGTPSP
jgi:general secretion pathway protein N